MWTEVGKGLLWILIRQQWVDSKLGPEDGQEKKISKIGKKKNEFAETIFYASEREAS